MTENETRRRKKNVSFKILAQTFVLFKEMESFAGRF